MSRPDDVGARTEALVAAPEGRAENAELFVLFKVDATEYALPASIVLQMESYGGATPVPGAPAFVAGIMQLRGKVLPVVNAIVEAYQSHKSKVGEAEKK